MKMKPSSTTTTDHKIENNNNSVVDISNVEDDEVSSIDAMELNVQDSKIGSSTQVICKNEDTYDPQKPTFTQYNRYSYCGELSSEVSVFRKNCIPGHQSTNGSLHSSIQYDEHDIYQELKSEVSVFNHSSPNQQPSSTNVIDDFDLNDTLKDDEDDFEFYQQLTSEVALYRLGDNLSSSTMFFDN